MSAATSYGCHRCAGVLQLVRVCHPDSAVDSSHGCTATCGKPLSCGIHSCARPSHEGPCGTCRQKIKVLCHCGKLQHKTTCGKEGTSCGQPCGKQLECGHFCRKKCHSGPCLVAASQKGKPPAGGQPCGKSLEGEQPCDRTCHPGPCDSFSEEKGETSSAASCHQPCGKKLDCGHVCVSTCHEGACGRCRTKVQVVCCCGKLQQQVRCCAKDSGKSCGRPCGKELACGHLCTTKCHAGNCGPCQTKLPVACRCGKQRQVGCGRKYEGTSCGRPCRKELACGHPCHAECHAGPCPKCHVKLQFPCFCGEGMVGSRCGVDFEGNSCGRVCNKLLACGTHRCEKICHRGPCFECTLSECRERPRVPSVKCPMCLEPFKTQGPRCPYSLICGHSFCLACCTSLEVHKKEKGDEGPLDMFRSCPSCQARTWVADEGDISVFKKNFGLIDVIAQYQHP